MDNEQKYEVASNAAQCAELLLQDLQSMNSIDPMWSMLVLPEIEKVVALKYRLYQIAAITKNGYY